MDYIVNTLDNLIHQTAFFNLTVGNYIMIAVACFFLYLAIRHEFEPLLLVPIAFGMLLVNIYPDIMLEPEKAANGVGGLLHYFYILDEWAIMPSLIFMGVGAMTDFGPLIANPKSFLLGAAAQFGIFSAYFGAIAFGFNEKAAAVISVQSGWASTIRLQRLCLSSAVRTALHLSSWRVSWDRQQSWDPSQWLHIPTCHWYRLSSRLS